MDIIVHTMEYTRAERVRSALPVRFYADRDYDEYKRIYNECFFDLRTALGRFPVECCDSREELDWRSDRIYILEIDGHLAGSVAIYGREIDDLIVAKEYQRRGYGQALLRFAVSILQRRKISPITLHVADWNQGALKMYLKNGFSIVKTEVIQ